MGVTIREAGGGRVLAVGDAGAGTVLRYEGNWYFAPEAVAREALRVSERTYTCPYKGTCFWVDAVDAQGATVARDVAWIYRETKPGHEAIRGRFGFYAGRRGATVEG